MREKSLNEREEALNLLVVSINTAFRILGARAATMLALVASVGLFGWAVYAEPNGWRVSAACLFSLIVFLPALWADARR